jgi:hypothetical protein
MALFMCLYVLCVSSSYNHHQSAHDQDTGQMAAVERNGRRSVHRQSAMYVFEIYANSINSSLASAVCELGTAAVAAYMTSSSSSAAYQLTVLHSNALRRCARTACALSGSLRRSVCCVVFLAL